MNNTKSVLVSELPTPSKETMNHTYIIYNKADESMPCNMYETKYDEDHGAYTWEYVGKVKGTIDYFINNYCSNDKFDRFKLDTIRNTSILDHDIRDELSIMKEYISGLNDDIAKLKMITHISYAISLFLIGFVLFIIH